MMKKREFVKLKESTDHKARVMKLVLLKEKVYKHYPSFQKKVISETNILTPHLLKSDKWF